MGPRASRTPPTEVSPSQPLRLGVNDLRLTVHVADLVAADPDAEAALWQFLFAADLAPWTPFEF